MLLIAGPSGAQLTWTLVLTILGALFAIVLLLWGLGRVLLHFFPSSGKYGAAGGNALLRADVFFRPSRQHVIEAREYEEQQDQDSGVPPSGHEGAARGPRK